MNTTTPSSSSPSCPLAISDGDLRRFDAEGYLAYENFLSPGEVRSATAAIGELIAKAYQCGRASVLGETSTLQDDLPGRQRLYIQYEPGIDASKVAPDDCEEHVRKVMWFVDEHPFFRHLAYEHPKVRALLSALLHADAVLFQEMMLIKPARIGGARDWHQDNAYFAVKPLDAVLGMWICFDDAEPENGCMHVLPGGHKSGPLLQNHSVQCTIPASRLDPARVVPVPLRAGGAMVFSGMLPHMTPANRSSRRRRAVQLHFRHPHSQIVSRREYAKLFAEADGTPAACDSWQYLDGRGDIHRGNHR